MLYIIFILFKQVKNTVLQYVRENGTSKIKKGYQTNTKQTVVNVGSVGRPFTPNAQSCYAIVDIFEDKTFEVRHKFVKYDNQKAAEILRKRTYKGADKLAEMIIHPTERYPK